MLKNVSLVESVKGGQQTWRLLGPDGLPVGAFDVFATSLLRKNPPNTRKSYCRHLAEFFDFLYEAAQILASEGRLVDTETLAQTIEAYDEYLVLGTGSGNEIASKVAASMPSPCVSRRSSSAKHAPVRRFLKLSERIRQQMVELTNAGIKTTVQADMPLVAGIGQRTEIGSYQRAAIVGNSMLASVISRGPKLIEEGILPTSSPDIVYEHERAFPFDKVAPMLGYLLTYRDKALYSFCSASGCRISEALQLVWDDIDTANQRVRLIDPKSRPNLDSYLALSPADREKLVWKGRTTSATLLIEPFASLFFENLALYIRHEYVPHGRHQFVFQYTAEGLAGRPYFLVSAASRNGVLSRAIKLAEVENVEGPHSLRHMYGTYLLNYFPRPNGSYGLPIGVVQKLMGHRSQRSTEKYARHDKDLIEAELRFANQMVFNNGQAKSIAELKREALLSRLAVVEKELLLLGVKTA